MENNTISELLKLIKTTTEYDVLEEFKGKVHEIETKLINPKTKSSNPLDNLPIIGEGVLMEVSSDEEIWYKLNVVGKLKDNRYLVYTTDKSDVHIWEFARTIPKTKITRAEFERLYEIID